MVSPIKAVLERRASVAHVSIEDSTNATKPFTENQIYLRDYA